MSDVNEVLKTVLGYQKSAYLFYINQLPLEEREALLKPIYKDMTRDLLKLDKFINYGKFNYPLWESLEECVDRRIPKIHSHADLNLEDYLIGLNQRNRLAWSCINLNEFFSFAKDKKILDFGCGGCFYADIFSSMAQSVHCYDKPDVMEFIRANIILRKDKCFLREDIELFNYEAFDIIWVSEVIHGKSKEEIRSLLRWLSMYLQPDGMIIINELLPDTPLSELFDIQMAIHTKGGKLYKPTEVYELFKEVKLEKKSDYHVVLGGDIA